jgi:hypothetical protein
LGIGSGDAKALAALTEADKEFEDKVRKSWHLMHSLVSALHENVVKSNTALTGTRPLHFIYLFICLKKDKFFFYSLLPPYFKKIFTDLFL